MDPSNSLLDGSKNHAPPPRTFREPRGSAFRKHVPNPILTRDLKSGRLVYRCGSRVREPPVHFATKGLLGCIPPGAAVEPMGGDPRGADVLVAWQHLAGMDDLPRSKR